ncbi:MAG TPA: BamA/TamA family outer membrane protein [Candidatus Marinimicrobia bacterium]|nr:BamA/TamA family outer membrane protein [Candidatus Neomarinimicrobiota bacterium]HRS51181.1 BamA/TamA family outer membrane protein [Candidatus Neomarinimicrobiota bacterium]HRU91580.1 BamA/TamA family outer membrane protein [Candidatus Neomarinimicrobiota bacterium]
MTNQRYRRRVLRIIRCLLIGFVGWFPAWGIEQDTSRAEVIFGEITVKTLDETLTDFTEIARNYTTYPVTIDSYEELTNKMLDVVLKDGYLYPVLTLSAVHPETEGNLTKLNPEFCLDRGERVVIDTVIYEGIKRTAPELLKRESAAILGKSPDSQKISAFVNNFKSYSFLTVQSQPEIVKTREGQFGLVVQLAEHSTNIFSGVVGYIPATATTEGYFTGEVNLNLNNISGRGRNLSVFWAKPNRYSQQIDLRYFEPWIRHTNFNAEGQFSQILRDTLVVLRSFEAGIGRRLFQNGSGALKFNYSSTMPTSGGRQLLGLNDLTTRGLGLSGRYDGRDYPPNPQKGLMVAINAYFSRRIEQDANRLWQYQTEINGEFDAKIRPQLVAACGWNFKGKWLSEGVPIYSDYYWFGGARSLRGYANELFGGSEIAWLNNEIRWLIGKNGRAHIFFDQGYYRRSVEGVDKRYYLHSYGVGLRLDSRMGIIGLDYGFGEGDTFTTAKIHIFLETNF